MADVGMLIMVERDKRDNIHDVVKSLQEKGLHVTQTIPRLRTIVGTSDADLVNEFKSVDGVEAVRHEGRIQLPDMDEKIPQ